MPDGRVKPVEGESRNATSIPAEIRGWNWGAFLFGPIWGIAHGVWIGLLVLVPYVGLVMMFVLGAKGNEWAWRNRRWSDIAEFKETQKKWARLSLGIYLTILVLAVLGLLEVLVFSMKHS